MAKYLVNLTTGQMDEKGIYWPLFDLLTQSGVMQSGSMAVSAQSTPDMTVKVAGAATGHGIVFLTTAGDMYYGRNTANENVSISSNSSGVTKTDAIVAYADLAGGIATSNNPDGLKFVAVRRSGSDTGNPTSGEISTAVSSNPYLVLAYVTVANGASSINSGNITDARTRAYIGTDLVPTAAIKDSAVTTGKIADANITTAKIADSNVTTAKINASAVSESRLQGSWFTTSDRSNAVNAFTAISGLTKQTFTTTGGLLLVMFNLQGLTLSAGVGYGGMIIYNEAESSVVTSFERAGTNFGTISGMAGFGYTSLPAGTYKIVPGTRGNGGTITWKGFNTIDVTIVELKR